MPRKRKKKAIIVDPFALEPVFDRLAPVDRRVADEWWRLISADRSTIIVAAINIGAALHDTDSYVWNDEGSFPIGGGAVTFSYGVPDNCYTVNGCLHRLVGWP